MYNNYRDELEIRKIKHEYISPLKRSYDFSVKQNKSHLFQN